MATMRICWRLAISPSPHTSTLAGRDFMVTRLASSPTRDAPSEGVRTGCRVERLKALKRQLWSFAARPLVQKIAIPLVVVSLLAVHAGLLAYSATTHSPTMNEPGHLVAGLSYWEFGRFDVYRVNPPLTRAIAALPVIAAGYEADWSSFYEGPGARPEFAMGADFIKANGERSIWLFTIARWACIPISLIGALFCFAWAKELYGTIAGLAALVLWCFDPNILAHAELVTPDSAATAFGIGAGYMFWRWLKKPAWNRAGLAALLLGLVQLSKMSWFFLFGLWPLMWVFWRLTSGDRRWDWSAWRKQGMQLSAILLGGLYLLNLGYLFDGSFTKLKEFTFVSETLAGPEDAGSGGNRFSKTFLADIPAPFPAEYVRGLDAQKYDCEAFSLPSYLGGACHRDGWWYYYLYALAVKTPIGLLLMAMVVIVLTIAIQSDHVAFRDDIVLISPAVILFLLVSGQPRLGHHFRYVLPILGSLFIVSSGLFSCRLPKKLVVWPIAIVALISSALTTGLQYPHTLSFFNVPSGGSSYRFAHLVGSNLDWGQDLLHLQDWLAVNRRERVGYLIYYGAFRPNHIGVSCDEPKLRPIGSADDVSRWPPGLYAISATYFHAPRWYSSDDPFHVFRNVSPLATIGNSIYIYEIDTPQ